MVRFRDGRVKKMIFWVILKQGFSDSFIRMGSLLDREPILFRSGYQRGY